MNRVGNFAAWTAALLLSSFSVAAAQPPAAPPMQNMPRGPISSGSGMPMMGGPPRMG